jgi:hypothetical protein
MSRCTVDSNPPKPMTCRLVILCLLSALAVPLLAGDADPTPARSRLGMNLAGPADWNTELPFVDVFRLARTWISQRQGQSWGKGPKLELDDNGWVKRLEPECWAETPLLTIPGGHFPGGEYVCLYEGEGRIEVNPWFCMPHLATDDYVRQFAEQVKRGLKPALKVYVEYSNEIWNGMFAQTRYAGDRGLELKFGEKHWEAGWRYSAYRSVQMFRIWEQVLGGRERLVRVIASQAANSYIAGQKLGFQDAWKETDALAIAPYITMNLSPDGKPASAEVSGWKVEQVLDYLQTNALPNSVRWIKDNKVVANKYRLKLIVYEGGQHAVGVGGGENNETLTKLLQAANRHPRLGQIYAAHLDTWRDQGGGDLFCVFSSIGTWSKWGSWGLLEHSTDDTPKYRAVTEWNLANPR